MWRRSSVRRRRLLYDGLRAGVAAAAWPSLSWSPPRASSRQRAAELVFQAPTLLPLAASVAHGSGLLVRLTDASPPAWGEQEGLDLGAWAPLDPFLRALNARLGPILNADFVQALAAYGSQRALPLVVRPYCLQHDMGASAAGAARAVQSWAALKAFVARRRASQPALYGHDWVVPPVWIAFVLGYGGALVRRNRVVLSDAGALAGLQTLTTMLALPAVAWSALPASVAVRLQAPRTMAPSGQGGSSGSPILFYIPPVSFAPLPPFPVGRIVPASQRPFAAPAQLASLPTFDRAVTDCVRFVLWLYQPKQQRLLMTLGLPPLVSDPVLQREWASGRLLPAALAGQRYARSAPLEAMRDVEAPLPPYLRGSATLQTVGALLAHRAIRRVPVTLRDLRSLEDILNAVSSLRARGATRLAAAAVQQFRAVHGIESRAASPAEVEA